MCLLAVDRPPLPRWVALLSALAVSVAMWSCSASSETDPPEPSGGGTTDGGGAVGGSGGSSTGGMTTTGGGGTGGSGGGTGGAAESGTQAADLVNAGDYASSTNYSMDFTFGQPTQHQGTMTSPSYRMQGGLIGAMGTL